MGQSTDAILFYGFHADEGAWDDFIGVDWEDTFCSRKAGMFAGDYDAKNKLLSSEPCQIESHCSAECPMPFVCVKASMTRAWRGYPKKIESLSVHPDWDAQLRAFCALMNVPWQEPRWWLLSMWS